MNQPIFKLVIRVLILAILAGGYTPIEGPLFGQQTSKKQSQKKKSPTKKKSGTRKKQTNRKKPKKSTRKSARKPTGKRTPSGRPTARKKVPTRKKRPAKGTRTRKPTSRKKPTRASVSRKTPESFTPAEKISAVELAGELFNLTDDLNTSYRLLARATKYLDPVDRKKVVKLESKPRYSLQDLEAAVERDPENQRLHRNLGLGYEAHQDWEKAKDIYLRQIAKDPLNPDVHYFLGSFYLNQGALGKARDAFEEALDLDPGHSATLEAMSVFVRNPAQRQLSSEILQRSSALDPKGPAVKIKAIQDRIEEGKYREAVTLATGAREEFPSHAGFEFLLGKAYQELGELVKAKTAYQKAIRIDPGQKETYMALGNLYYGQGKFIYAALAYSDAVRLEPGDGNARYYQGLGYFNAGEWQRAAAAWEDLLHYEPHYPMVRTLLPQAYYVLAVEYNRRGEPALGRTSFSKAISVNPNSGQWLPGSMKTLGKYYRDRGMHKEALAAYREVAELRPMDAGAYLGMGISYWKMKEVKLARAAWERSLELDPDNNEARGWLIISQRGSG